MSLVVNKVTYGADVAVENEDKVGVPSGSVDIEATREERVSEIDMIQMIKHGGIVGYLIILLSVVAIALVIEYSLTIRKSALMPSKTVDLIGKLIAGKRHHEIAAHCGDRLIGKIVSAGMAEVNFGYNAMVKAMEDSGEESGAKLTGRVEHLNIIGNIAPMLGLLGTVIGMLITFNRIFEASQVTGIVDPRQLAGGIFKALVTTVMGLIVAIPSLYASAVFRNRINALFAEVMAVAGQLITPFKSLDGK
jgi:biopolymer transport protein ExbB